MLGLLKMIREYLNHLLTCKNCAPASLSYCVEAIELKLEYEANFICSLPAGKERTKACENFKRVAPELYERLREVLKRKYQEAEDRVGQHNAS